VAALLAADATNRSRLAEADELARSALASEEPRAAVMAHEVLADLALYDGRLDESAHHALELRRAASASGDTHLEVMGLTNLALTAAYSGRDADAERVVAEMAAMTGEVAPSDRAWCRYAAGEVVAEAQPAAAIQPLRDAIVLGEEVGNRLVASVARTTLATALHRTGDVPGALAAFATGLRESIAYGNHVHATTTLRNVIALLAELGAQDDAAVLLGTLERAGTKATFGAEAARLSDAVDAVGGQDGDVEVRRRTEEASTLGLSGALHAALAAVERLEA